MPHHIQHRRNLGYSVALPERPNPPHLDPWHPSAAIPAPNVVSVCEREKVSDSSHSHDLAIEATRTSRIGKSVYVKSLTEYLGGGEAMQSLVGGLDGDST